MERTTTVSRLAGLLTVPNLHPNSVRIELLIHLACLHCNGSGTPSAKDLSRWLNTHLGQTLAARFEDPSEDVFVANVMAETGNYRLFNGLWEGNDYYLQATLDTLFGGNSPPNSAEMKRSIFALLLLSDTIAERCRLQRWVTGDGTPGVLIDLPPDDEVERRAELVHFSVQDCKELAIAPDDITPFIADPAELQQLAGEAIGNSFLERHPILPTGAGYILAVPSAVSAAIRRYALEWVYARRLIPSFERNLRFRQSSSIFGDILPRRMGTEPITIAGLPGKSPNLPSIDDVVCAFDRDKCAHVVLIHDDMTTLVRDGLAEGAEFVGVQDVALKAHLLKVANHVVSSHGCKFGFTILIACGLGRGRTFSLPNLPENWSFSHFTVADAIFFSRSEDSSLLRLWKMCRERERLSANGLQISQINGELNAYAFWKKNGYTFVPRQMAHPGTDWISFMTDFLLPLRKQVRNGFDEHAVPLGSTGPHIRVIRVRTNSYFEGTRQQPIYASEEQASDGRLMGCVETPKGVWWVRSQERPESRKSRSIVAKLWDAILFWTNRLAPVIESRIPVETPYFLSIDVCIEDIEKWEDDHVGDIRGAEIRGVQVSIESSSIRLQLTADFRGAFMRPDNAAEKQLMRSIILGSLSILIPDRGDSEREQLADEVLAVAIPNDDARLIHMFETRSPGDYLAAVGAIGSPRFVQPEDVASCSLGLAWRVDPALMAGDISGKDECKAILNKAVKKLWIEIRDELQTISRRELAEAALLNTAAISRDSEHWRQTARALLSLHADQNDVLSVANKREIERTRAALAYRIMLEMGVCTCPVEGGGPATQSKLDHLSAAISELIAIANRSDAIHHELCPDMVTVFPNGTIEGDVAIIREIVQPYVADTHRDAFEGAASEYAKLYRERSQAKRVDEIYPAEMLSAFQAEYGLSIDEFFDVLAELYDLAIEAEQPVVSLPIAKLKYRMGKNRGLSADKATQFLNQFGFWPRPRWDEPLNGFTRQDIYPWRFERRLSVIMRPIVLLSDDDNATAIFSIQQVGVAASYVLERIESGWYRQESVTSGEMKRFIGSVADEKGKEFEHQVAQRLSELGWNVAEGVQLSSMGAPDKLGDVDVFGWKDDGGPVLVIECKRLKGARTAGEIGEQLREFKGETEDRLGKHLARLNWIEANPSKVCTFLKIRRTRGSFLALLVTNAIVPMKYATELPLPLSQVVPFSSLDTGIPLAAAKRPDRARTSPSPG